MLLDEEFGGTRLDRKRWYTCYNSAPVGQGCTNNPSLELEWYRAPNVIVADGLLHLVARVQRAHGHPFTSGMIQSGGTPTTPAGFSFLYGYAEMRAKFPRGAGMWPAFWLLQTNGRWPPEIDIMEWQGVDPKGDVTTIHWRGGDGQDEQDGSTYYAAVPLCAAYHTYAVDWEANAVTWYFDGRAVKRFAEPARIPHLPMYVLLNLAIGGWEKGQLDPNPSDFPADFAVDYVRVWSKRPSSPLPESAGRRRRARGMAAF